MNRRHHLLLTWLVSLGLACTLWSAGRMHLGTAGIDEMAGLCSVSADHGSGTQGEQSAPVTVDGDKSHAATCDLCCASVLAMVLPVQPHQAWVAPADHGLRAWSGSDPELASLPWPGPRPRGPPLRA